MRKIPPPPCRCEDPWGPSCTSSKDVEELWKALAITTIVMCLGFTVVILFPRV